MEQSLSYRGGDFKPWQRRLRAKVRRLLGDMPQQRVPLNVKRLWQRRHPNGFIEKIIFTAEPNCDVPAYVCIPNTSTKPYPFMICLQGHSTGMHNSIAALRDDESTPIEIAGDRDFAIQCMQHGVAALCIEQRSLGERLEKVQAHTSKHSRCHDAFVQALMLGRTLLGERVYDVSRGIDYLASRGDADMRRIGIMGNSAGGTTAVFAAAVLPQISYAMPSCSFCTFRDSKMALYHCCCGYLPNMLKYAEMADVMGLFAPRPVVIVAGENDPIIPLAAVQKSYQKLRSIYRAANAEEHCHLVVGNEGHRFYAEQAWPLMMKEIISSESVS